jgi:plasmid stabilization system protein ParE
VDFSRSGRDLGIEEAEHAGTRFAFRAGMPQAWSDKDERQYEHIKDSSLERGFGEDRAEEIAARTVNKRRRTEGRTPNRRTMGTGNPNRGLDERSRDEVYNRARELNIKGRSKMTRSELVEAIRHTRARG